MPKKKKLAASSSKKKGAATDQFQVVYRIPPGMPLLSTDLLVSQTSTERGLFYLTFFQTRAPFEGPFDRIEADCVARLALTPAVMARVVILLRQNFERFQSVMEKEMAQAEQDMQKDKK